MTRATTLALCAAMMSLAACAPPLHLQYDFGRAFTTTVRLQADLTRPSVATETYNLYGVEAVKIRLNVEDVVTEVESGDSSFR